MAVFSTKWGQQRGVLQTDAGGQDWDLISIPQCRSALQKEEVKTSVPNYLKGHYATWNYSWIRLQIRSLLGF